MNKNFIKLIGRCVFLISFQICCIILLLSCAKEMGGYAPSIDESINHDVNCKTTLMSSKKIKEIGQGTTEDPYVICNLEQFLAIGHDLSIWQSHFVLGDDLNFEQVSSDQIRTIGFYNKFDADKSVPFTGSFDGKDHVIKNLSITSGAGSNFSVGIFGFLSNASISNLKIERAQLRSENDYSGILAGYLINSSLANIEVFDSSVTSYGRFVGTVSGYIKLNNTSKSKFSNIKVNSDVGGYDVVGHLTGWLDISEGHTLVLENFNSNGKITEVKANGSTVGGVAGFINVTNSAQLYFIGVGTSGLINFDSFGSFVGGIAGTIIVDGLGTILRFSKINSDTKISTPAAFNSGFVGGVSGNMVCKNGSSCFIEKTKISNNITIESSSSSNRSYIAGFIGHLNINGSGTLFDFSNNKFDGSITLNSNGANHVGGFFGYVYLQSVVANFTNSISLMSLDGSSTVGSSTGSIVGSVVGVPTFQSIYWNSDKYIKGSNSAISGIYPKNTFNLSQPSTYVNWDFSTVWLISSNYETPELM